LAIVDFGENLKKIYNLLKRERIKLSNEKTFDMFSVLSNIEEDYPLADDLLTHQRPT